MAHRAKHRRAALARRVKAARMIASDRTPAGLLAYERMRLALAPVDKAQAFLSSFGPGKKKT